MSQDLRPSRYRLAAYALIDTSYSVRRDDELLAVHGLRDETGESTVRVYLADMEGTVIVRGN